MFLPLTTLWGGTGQTVSPNVVCHATRPRWSVCPRRARARPAGALEHRKARHARWRVVLEGRRSGPGGGGLADWRQKLGEGRGAGDNWRRLLSTFPADRAAAS
jgi:hypothetical protein